MEKERKTKTKRTERFWAGGGNGVVVVVRFMCEMTAAKSGGDLAE